MKKIHATHRHELFIAFRKALKNPRLFNAFMEDVLTPSEYADILLRLQIVKLLIKGVPQRIIAKRLGISIVKITRGSRMLLNKKGGFNRLLNKYEKIK